MPAEIIQSNYEQLDVLARSFRRQADTLTQLQRTVEKTMNALQNGWQGKGSAAFFSEMNGKVLPTLGRLNNAMQQSQRSTLQIKALLRQAEEDAASVFRGGHRSQVASDGGANLNGGAAGGGAVASQDTGTAAATANAAAVVNPKSIFQESKMKEMIGRHFQGEDSPETNRLMEKLLQNPKGAELQQTLDRLADIRGVPRDEFRAQYDKFLAVRAQAESINGKADAIDLGKHGDFLGTTASMRYGKVVGDVFGIDPVFGALLNPTGGMVGPGNSAYNPGDNDPIGYHGIFHDAAGYLYNFHNMGPGYDYLGHELTRDTADPLTGQRGGVQWWLKQSQLDAPGPDFLLENPVVPGVLGTAYEVIVLDGKQVVTGVTKGVGKLFDGDVVGFGKNMGRTAVGIARMPVDTVTGLSRTAVNTATAAGEVAVDGIKKVGKWLGF